MWDVVADWAQTLPAQYFITLWNWQHVKYSISAILDSQTKEQTESVNQPVQANLYTNCSYNWIDWITLLPMVEYIFNNSKYCTTTITTFYSNCKSKPSMHCSPHVGFHNLTYQLWNYYIVTVSNQLSKQVEGGRKWIETCYNMNGIVFNILQTWHWVILNSKTIIVKHRWKKLENMMNEPFNIHKFRHNN